jgi:hypothetical protein
MNTRRTTLGLLLAGSLHAAVSAAPASAPAPASPAAAFADETAAARVERLLTAMGGRAAWARAKFVHVESTHHELTIRDPFTNRIWNDFSAPRVRLEAIIEGALRRRGIDGDKGWRLRDGQATPLAAEQVASEHAWWESNVYRTLHRLAGNDPTLTARPVGDSRLEIFRADGKRLNWFLLNLRGEPVRFGTWDSESASIFGPLVAEPSGVKHPHWGTTADGSFRFEILRFETAESVPADVSFSSS